MEASLQAPRSCEPGTVLGGAGGARAQRKDVGRARRCRAAAAGRRIRAGKLKNAGSTPLRIEAQAMTDAWTIKNKNGDLLSRFVRDKRHDVERALLPIHYDTHRLLAEPSYREQFQQHLEQILDREGWTIVPITLIERSTAS